MLHLEWLSEDTDSCCIFKNMSLLFTFCAPPTIIIMYWPCNSLSILIWSFVFIRPNQCKNIITQVSCFYICKLVKIWTKHHSQKKKVTAVPYQQTSKHLLSTFCKFIHWKFRTKVISAIVFQIWKEHWELNHLRSCGLDVNLKELSLLRAKPCLL